MSPVRRCARSSHPLMGIRDGDVRGRKMSKATGITLTLLNPKPGILSKECHIWSKVDRDQDTHFYFT